MFGLFAILNRKKLQKDMSNEMTIHIFIKIRLISAIHFSVKGSTVLFLCFKEYVPSLSHKNDVYYD